MATPSAQFSLTLRMELPHESGAFANVTAAITGAIVAVDPVEAHGDGTLREVSRRVARGVAEEAERAGPERQPTNDTAELSIPGR